MFLKVFFGFVLMWCISVKIMVILVRQKNVIFSQPFLKMRKFLLDMRKDFLIMSNFYLVEILSEPNSLTIVTSKKILKMSNYVLILSIFFSKWESCIVVCQKSNILTEFRKHLNDVSQRNKLTFSESHVFLLLSKQNVSNAESWLFIHWVITPFIKYLHI